MRYRESTLGPILVAAVLATLSSVFAAPAETEVGPPPSYAEMRKLAGDGHRAEALLMAEGILEGHPGDLDTRIYYGILLSWEKRYEEARAQLNRVLLESPDYADARTALINVESWDGKWERVDELARSAQAKNPESSNDLLNWARALRNMNRTQDALGVLEGLIEKQPRNREARGLRESIRDDMRRWAVHINQYSARFNDGRSGWQERQLTLRRHTEAGTIGVGYTRTVGFGLPDSLISVDFYPRFRPGTYGYLAAEYSPQQNLYPKTRMAAEIFQTLPRATEVSFGIRHFEFPTPKRLYTASLTRYFAANWMFTARTYLSGDQTGISKSIHMLFRRYFDGPEKYIGIRYGVGASPFEVRSLNDIELLKSHTFIGDVNWRFNSGLGFSVLTGFSFQGPYNRLGLQQLTLSTGVNYRF